MNIVAENIFVNYDSVIQTYIDYHNYVFSDSSKELFRVVSINAIHRQTELSLYSKQEKLFHSRQFVSGYIYKSREKDINIGYYDIFELATGINDYGNTRGNDDNIIEFALQKKRPESFLRIKQKLKSAMNEDLINICEKYEVRDTTYQQQKCYVLIKTCHAQYRKDINKKYYSKHVNVVNKTDFAIVYFRYDIKDGNDKKRYRLSSYKKSGNYYFEDRFEFLQPRFQSSNDNDLYTFEIRNATTMNRNRDREKEFNLIQFQPIDIFTDFSSFLKKSSKIDNNGLKIWSESHL